MDRRYFSCAALASYDDSEPPANPGRVFSQEEVNRLLADDRRKHQARIDRVQRTLEEVSASKNLSVKEREQLATQLEAMAAENRTREEQLVHERTQLEKQHAQMLADEKKNTDAWRKRFEDSAIQNALVDASHRSDAFSTDQILRLLRPSTRVVERADERGKGTGDYEVVVDLPDTDEQGNPTTRTLSARDALETMQTKPTYGNLFKSNAVSGIASSSGAGVTPGGKIDVRNLTQEQYMELRRTNPAAVGLRPNKRSHL